MKDISVESKLDEDVLRAFVWAVYNFFTITTGKEPKVEVPYLYEGMSHQDYTGAIGVSGSHKGAIYLTLGEGVINSLLGTHAMKYFPLDNPTPEEMEEHKLDYAGEIINVIAGNVRNYLGEHFLISVPIVINAPETPLHLSQKGCGIVFPISWENGDCSLILNLSPSPKEVDHLAESV